MCRWLDAWQYTCLSDEIRNLICCKHIYCNASNTTPGVLFIFGGQKCGFYSRGGLIEGGLINFFKFVYIFYPKVCLFMVFNDEILPLLLIKHVNFHFSEVKFVIIQK